MYMCTCTLYMYVTDALKLHNVRETVYSVIVSPTQKYNIIVRYSWSVLRVHYLIINVHYME